MSINRLGSSQNQVSAMTKKHHEPLFISHVAALVTAGLLLSAVCFWCASNPDSNAYVDQAKLVLRW